MYPKYFTSKTICIFCNLLLKNKEETLWKSTGQTDSFTWPGSLGNGICRALHYSEMKLRKFIPNENLSCNSKRYHSMIIWNKFLLLLLILIPLKYLSKSCWQKEYCRGYPSYLLNLEHGKSNWFVHALSCTSHRCIGIRWTTYKLCTREWST